MSRLFFSRWWERQDRGGRNETGGIKRQKNGLELVGADPGASFCLAPTQELYAGKLPPEAAAGADRPQVPFGGAGGGELPALSPYRYDTN